MESTSPNPNKSPIANEHARSRWPTMIDGKRKAKKRVRNFTPKDRAAHRVFEKSRREAFNDQLMELARLIPATSAARRLSKYTIVEESISYHRVQDQRCLYAVDGIRALLAERDELLGEVNALRTLFKPDEIDVRVAKPIDDHVLDLLRHERELVQNGIRASKGAEPSESSDRERTYGNNPESSSALPQRQICGRTSNMVEFTGQGLPGDLDPLAQLQGDDELWEDLGPLPALPVELQGAEFLSHDLDCGSDLIPSLNAILQPPQQRPLHTAYGLMENSRTEQNHRYVERDLRLRSPHTMNHNSVI
ncbi:hypothetical protein BDV25DRAFT_139424 [Aspergillus avenaceus]|uniref:BHLH domain-containing protein n=1 Tax=Aspergillus avenaceus TaxID=36643 RepID=A0A5N6TWR1_ASPAV|nr:hypothetical protein BDV25DRAFT_139424 [Aspergillus avenaceus]